jgi:hypothetical protein
MIKLIGDKMEERASGADTERSELIDSTDFGKTRRNDRVRKWAEKNTQQEDLTLEQLEVSGNHVKSFLSFETVYFQGAFVDCCLCDNTIYHPTNIFLDLILDLICFLPLRPSVSFVAKPQTQDGTFPKRCQAENRCVVPGNGSLGRQTDGWGWKRKRRGK